MSESAAPGGESDGSEDVATRDPAELERAVERISEANRQLRAELESARQELAEREAAHAEQLEALRIELRQKRRNLDRIHWASRRDRQMLARLRRNPLYRIARRVRHSRPVVAALGSPHQTVSAERLIAESGREAPGELEAGSAERSG